MAWVRTVELAPKPQTFKLTSYVPEDMGTGDFSNNQSLNLSTDNEM